MGIADKAKNAAQDLTGKAEEVIGDATTNERLEAEGKADQAEAKARKAGENIKDTLS
ncbi:CsbD family protein [Phycicoccus jejuensis]|uniref:CsbD family protein n=1 Tax=Phycicoccus jejuensis TaxID=367299 RepID=UPI00385154F1